MDIALTAFTVAILGVIVWRVVVAYRSTTGTLGQRLITAGHGSAVILWQYVVMGAVAFLGNADKLAAALNMPEAQSIIQKLPPQWVGGVFIVVSLITIIARLRTL